jgi:hypothetical protein
MEDLDGYQAGMFQIPGEKDRGHAALAELALDQVSLGQPAPQAFEGVHAWNKVARPGIRQRITLRCTLVPQRGIL